jgi:hypothetical protein
MKNLILISLLICPFVAKSFVTLGTDASCDYDANNYTINEVMNLVGLNEIRITKQKEYFENVRITTSTTLVGGYQNCDDAFNNIKNGVTIINGSNSLPVIRVLNNTNTIFVNLHHLKLKNGKGLGSSQGGGLTVYDNNNVGASVRVYSSIISNNVGINGGGIFSYGTSVALELIDTIVLNNQTSGNGGGIYCFNSYIQLDENSGVSLNHAFSESSLLGNGGGVYATQGCYVDIKSATNEGLFDFKGINGNSASAHGGGIYAKLGSTIRVQSQFAKRAININNNYADSNSDNLGNGGAIYLEDPNTFVKLYGANINNNSGYSGGAISAHNHATLNMGKINNECWNTKQCNNIESNTTSKNGGQGGAFYVNKANLNVAYSDILLNRADLGTVIFSENNSNVRITNSNIYDNGMNGVDGWEDIFTYKGVNTGLNIAHITSAKNKSQGAILSQTNSTHTIENSIFYEPDQQLMADFVKSTGSKKCLLLSSDNGMNGMTGSLVGNPGFVDFDNNDFHINSFSMAIDLCAASSLAAENDRDNEAFGYDDPNQLNIAGSYDAGADETYESDIIFNHAFD